MSVSSSRRILQIGVDDQDLLARAQIQARGQRELMPVIARQVDRDEVRVGGRQCAASPASCRRAIRH